MIYWIVLGLFVAALVAFPHIIDDCSCSDGLFASAISAVVVFGVAALLMTAFISQRVIEETPLQAESQQRYEAIVYQVENRFYETENEVGKQQLVDQIREWNEDLAKGKAMQHNLWVGIFWHQYYDQFDYIALPQARTGGGGA